MIDSENKPLHWIQVSLNMSVFYIDSKKKGLFHKNKMSIITANHTTKLTVTVP